MTVLMLMHVVVVMHQKVVLMVSGNVTMAAAYLQVTTVMDQLKTATPDGVLTVLMDLMKY